jgi:Flp pilus assembly protein TadB
MFVNPLGWFMLGIAAVMLGIGNFLIRRLTAIV